MSAPGGRASVARQPLKRAHGLSHPSGSIFEPVLATPWFDRLMRAAQPPGLCAVCHDWGHERICTHCIDRYAAGRPRCRRCALEVAAETRPCAACVAQPPPYDAALAAVDYAYPWDRLIAAFKFGAALELAAPFARLLLQAQREAALPPPDLLLPVPLSAARLRERGYNQAWELARRLGRALGRHSHPQVLRRLRDTPHQLALPLQQRAGNVRAAFAVEPHHAAELQGRSVALVDDVMTSGTTAAEIARVLRRAGAARIEVWVVARTPAPGRG
jgi:ComF family protein